MTFEVVGSFDGDAHLNAYVIRLYATLGVDTLVRTLPELPELQGSGLHSVAKTNGGVQVNFGQMASQAEQRHNLGIVLTHLHELLLVADTLRVSPPPYLESKPWVWRAS